MSGPADVEPKSIKPARPTSTSTIGANHQLRRANRRISIAVDGCFCRASRSNSESLIALPKIRCHGTSSGSTVFPIRRRRPVECHAENIRSASSEPSQRRDDEKIHQREQYARNDVSNGRRQIHQSNENGTQGPRKNQRHQKDDRRDGRHRRCVRRLSYRSKKKQQSQWQPNGPETS